MGIIAEDKQKPPDNNQSLAAQHGSPSENVVHATNNDYLSTGF